MFGVDINRRTVHDRTMPEEKKEIFQEDSSLLEAARQQSMQEGIANILEDCAGKIRALKATEDISLEKMLLNYWDGCNVEMVRSLVKHSVKPSNLIYLLIGATYEATLGTAKEKDNAILQMVLRCRVTDPSSQH
jgi:hypothetical protein